MASLYSHIALGVEGNLGNPEQPNIHCTVQILKTVLDLNMESTQKFLTPLMSATQKLIKDHISPPREPGETPGLDGAPTQTPMATPTPGNFLRNF